VEFALQIISGLAAAAGVWFAGWQLRESRKATQLQVFDATFKDVRALEHEYYTSVQGTGEAQEQQWCNRFFNTLEYLAFLINTKLVPDKLILRFYKDALIEWYDEIFLTKATIDQRTNRERFPELKQLRERLKRASG
jgi:hypothetical protein